MASSPHKKRRSREQHNNNQGILERWFAGDVEAMTTFMHDMSIKQINVPKVLEFSWLKSGNLAEPRVVLKHQRLKHFLKITRNVYPDLVKVFYTNLTQDGRKLVSHVKGVKITVTTEVWKKCCWDQILKTESEQRTHDWNPGT